VVVQSPAEERSSRWRVAVDDINPIILHPTNLTHSPVPTSPASRWWGFCYGKLWGPPGLVAHRTKRRARGSRAMGNALDVWLPVFNISPTCQTAIWKTVVPQASRKVGISRCSAHAAALHKDERLNLWMGCRPLIRTRPYHLGDLNLSSS
jgi:hypothetical protein